MRSVIASGSLVCMAFLLMGAQDVKIDSEKSRTVLTLENAWNQAEVNHDAKALELLLAETFVYTDSDGSFMNRSRWLSHVKLGVDDYQQLSNEDQTAHVYGDTVVVTGAYRERIRIMGKSVLRRGRFTDTWIYRNGRWECVASQATLITL